MKYEFYVQQIDALITQLNESTKDQKQKILEEIKRTDQTYLEEQGMTVNGQVLFSRHGECSGWGQKRFGISPNAPISDKAAQNMVTTNQATQALLSHPNETPRIIISPMIRAMQTASLIIPENIQANISIEPALSENSSAPSGLDVRSTQDLETVSKKAPFFSLKRILFFLTSLIYGAADFNALNQKRQEAADKIQSHNIPNQDILIDGKVPQSLDYDGDKIKDTKQIINDTTEKDLWLIGHGKNFKAFFKDLFSIETSFKYGETRVAYKIESEGGEQTLYTPPYSLVINQKTGEIEGHYTGISKTSIKESVQQGTNPEGEVEDSIFPSNVIMRTGLGATNTTIATQDISQRKEINHLRGNLAKTGISPIPSGKKQENNDRLDTVPESNYGF
ncbi:phosphoglycerate mutase family protein [Legionella feeleii]|uniref:Coiled-coil protein n=1 Tax=Legionella feeleii TaxID=453 RepID=A0A0W0TWG8_9GAMM|nr:phosphoglycerate mutase family protein [Legionella feeleii]KTC99806.1 coiled-coil protein [Legionella feeleii]SPX59309.1 coiled-coil protein [Legionella feeleii]